MKKEKTPVVQAEAKMVYPHEALQKIENERTIFWKSYRFHNTLKLIVMMFCLAMIIVAFIVFPTIFPKEKSGLQTGLTIGIAILALAGTYGYSLFVRKKFDKKLKEYFGLYFNSINEFVFEDKAYSDVEVAPQPGKITLEEFNGCKLYKDVIEAGSRGLTTFKYNKLEMSIVDCAGNIKAEKRVKPVFVGKMVRAKASYKGEKPVYVYIKGNDRALPPTAIDDVKNVLENEKIVVRSDAKDWKKVLNSGVMKAIESIKTDKILVDVALSIYENKVFVMMGYDDPLMVLPLQNQFDCGPTETFKKDILAISKLVEALNK